METFTEKQGCLIIEDFIGIKVKEKTFDCCIAAIRVYDVFRREYILSMFSNEDYIQYCNWKDSFNQILISYNIREIFVLIVSAIKWLTKTLLKYDESRDI